MVANCYYEYPIPAKLQRGEDILFCMRVLDDLRLRGCKYVLVMKRVFGSDVELPLARCVAGEDYTIYRVE